MKKITLLKLFSLLIGVMMAGSVWGQTTFTWNFGTTSGNALPSSGSLANLEVGGISIGNTNGTVTMLSTTSASTGYTGSSGQFNAGNAARTGALSTGASGSAYFQFTLTPASEYSISFSSISFGTRSTSTAPQAYTLRSSKDSYATDIATGTITANSSWALKSNTGLSYSGTSGEAITFRIYGYNGTGSASINTINWRIDDLSISVDVTGGSMPTITVGSITGFGNQTVNTTSAEKSYNVSGSNLTADIVITPPLGFEISLTSGTGFIANPNTIVLEPVDGNVGSTPIYVIFKPTAVQAYSSNITHTSTDADSKNVPVTGTGVSPANPASFTATAFSASQINLAATANASSQPIVVVFNSTGIFTVPTDGEAAGEPGSTFAGGTVHHNGTAISLANHTGLSANQTVYYKAFSYDALHFFSPGSTANATTFFPTITVDPSALSGFTYVFENGPSAQQSFTVGGSHLTDDITITPSDNYEISTGTGGFFEATNPITLTELGGTVASTPIYVRLKAGLGIGTYNGEQITCSSDIAAEKTVTCSGSVTAPPAPGYLVDFEGTGETKTAYGSATVNLSGINWDMTEALIGTDAADWKNGARSARMRGYGTSAMTMLADKANGIGTVSFNYRRYGTDTQVDWKVEYSTNAGVNWTQIGSAFTALASTEVQVFSEAVNVSGNIRIRIKRATESGTANARLNIDDINITDYTSGGNVPPSITNIVQNPASGITSSTTVSVSADVTDSDGTVAGVALYWGTTTGSLTNNITMTLSSGDTYTTDTDIPAQLNGVTVYYEIYAIDDDTDDATSPEQSYTVTDPVAEPTEHPTDFTATANSSSAITVTWTDAVPAAESYLIKGSAISYAAIDAPDDGTPEGDGVLVKNVDGEVETHQFTGLNPSTPYYFKIFPYNGTDEQVNYKVDGTIPQATATTLDPEVVKWDGGASTTAWGDAANWSTNVVPSATDVVLLDNSLLSGSYEVILPSGAVKTTIKKLTISPENPNTITLTLPSDNTYGASNDAGFVVGDNTASTDDIVINAGGILVNASGGTLGNGIQVNALANGTLRINDGGKYVHKTSRGTGGTAAAVILSTVAGTEYGIYEYDVPGTGNFSIAASGRTYGSLVLTRTDGAAIYNTAGGSPLTINGDFVINPGVTYSTTLTGEHVIYGDLTLSATSDFILGASSKATISGALTNNADATDLVIKSDATGTGSLINSSENVLATVERYLTKYNALGDQMFHFISSPIEAQEIQPEFVSSTPDPVQDFYAFDEQTNMWINTKDENGDWNTAFEDNFLLGKGYLVAYPTDVTKNFIGVLNYSGIVITCTNTAGQGEGWNLIGNKFPSAIDWDYISANGLGTGMDNALYYYDNATQNYLYYIHLDGSTIGSGQRYIPAMQGFMVHAKTTGVQTVTISDAARTHLGQVVFYKSTTSVPGSLSLKVSSSGFEDEMFVHFTNGATTQFDGKFDAFKLSSYNAQVPQLYTMSSDNRKLAINGLPELSESLEIPVYFYAGIAGQQSITADLSNLETTVYLVDLKTGTSHNLTENPVYSFTAQAGNDPNRFLLKFEMVGIGENPAIGQTSIYSHGQSVYISSIASVDAMVSVFNITGQQVYSQQLVLDGLKQITLNVSTGWYVVQAVTSGSAVSRKVFIR